MTSDEQLFNVLFLCSGNSGRSIMAEAILNHTKQRQFQAFSANSPPFRWLDPYAVWLLKKRFWDVHQPQLKDWQEFATSGAPKLDFVLTLCDNVAKEPRPVWPGQPMTAHWSIPDPAETKGTPALKRLAFADCFRMLTNRINTFISLPLRSLDQPVLQKELEAIGRTQDARERRQEERTPFAPRSRQLSDLLRKCR
jgi:arsenate reductase (thioredoxin)